jgi:tetratricopeptide (TPR) repeat protein
VECRLALGRLEDALADVEHLEALARGARGKYAVWLRAGGAWRAAGLLAHAGAIFERALRYAPDEPGALGGLGLALIGEGREARGVALLERALDIAGRRGEPDSLIRLALAEALAERLDDLPTAVAHASAIPASSPEALAARGLEGRWRARLGDLAGAALAFARLRDFASSLAPSADGEPARTIVALLLEAAAMERDRRSDPLAAQRHLAVALRLLPHHAEARRAYREVGALLRGSGAAPGSYQDETPATPEPALVTSSRLGAAAFEIEPDAPREPAIDLALDEDVEPDEQDIVRAARVEELTRRLRDAPADDGIADELAALLEDLGRGHELVALLAGRLEDVAVEHRPALVARALTIFERMASRAAASGHSAEASLYRDAIATLS